MVIVLEARSSDASLIGTCSARCHTAKGARCKCICGGINHGAGLRQAIENIEQDRLTREPHAVYVTRLIQRPLFTQEKDKEPR